MSSESTDAFRPLPWASGAVAQTAIAQLRFRTWGVNEMARAARGEVLRLSGGVSVEGFFSAQVGRETCGLVVMLSGWEGHANSPYMLNMGRGMYRAGYEVFRINYPDHGGTHDLNESAFHFGMFDKMGEAVHRIVGAIRTRPVFVIGFSMGGNLALNLACRGLPGLKGVFAISPAFDFAHAITALQKSFFHRFFLKSWKSSLHRKQELFPHRHDFSALKTATSVGEVASALLEKEAGQQSLEDYTARYSLTPGRMRQLTVPAHVLAAADDPIVGPINYQLFRGLPRLSMHLQQHGGHVGFLSSLLGPAYYEELILGLLQRRPLRPPVETPAGD